MADENIKQVMQDAITDADSLERFINGSDSETVLTRLSAEYPTLRNAVRIMFESGGIPATPYPSKAAMESSSLDNGSYAVVTDDEPNNGVYLKALGAWSKSSYNPITVARAPNGTDIDALQTGVYYLYQSDLGRGFVISFRHDLGMSYQYFVNDRTGETFERGGNGSSTPSNFVWQEWRKVIKGRDVLPLLNSKASLNIIKNPELTSDGSYIYQATHTKDGAVLEGSGTKAIFYDHKVDGEYLDIGNTIVFSSQALNTSGAVGAGDISIQFKTATGSDIGATKTAELTTDTQWQSLVLTEVIPPNCAEVRLRFISRGKGAVKFKNAVLASDSAKAQVINLNSKTSKRVVTVGKSGGDYDSVQSAIDSLTDGGEVVVLDSADYREALTINTNSTIKISAVKGERVNLFGSDMLELTKTDGYTKVYQAPLARKPVGMGAGRGQAMIAEWGTPSKEILSNEQHFLQHSLTHRLPYTEMFEVDSIADVDSNNGSWFWQNGIIYLSATDGSDASKKRYEARVRSVLNQNKGNLELVRVTSWFSNDAGMTFNGTSVTRKLCAAYGARANGFSDNANFTQSYRDRAGGNGNDGFNVTVEWEVLDRPELSNRLEAVYFDPYGHDNGDDGLSCHYRSDATVYGGLFEYNTKADVVHVTGANCVCYNTVSRGTLSGFYAATDPSNDNERLNTVFRCVGTVSNNNEYAYRTANNAVLNCVDVKAINPEIWGFYQSGAGAINATDCRYLGDSSKLKSGNVVITNTSLAE